MRDVLPHSGMLPSEPGTASAECSGDGGRKSIGFQYEFVHSRSRDDAIAVISRETASKRFAGRRRWGQGPKPASPVREAQSLRPAPPPRIISSCRVSGRCVHDQASACDGVVTWIRHPSWRITDRSAGTGHCEALRNEALGAGATVKCFVGSKRPRALLRQRRRRRPICAPARVATLLTAPAASEAARQDKRQAVPPATARRTRAMSAMVPLQTILVPSAPPPRMGQDDAGRAGPLPSAYRLDAPHPLATPCVALKGIARWSAQSERSLRPWPDCRRFRRDVLEPNGSPVTAEPGPASHKSRSPCSARPRWFAGPPEDVEMAWRAGDTSS